MGTYNMTKEEKVEEKLVTYHIIEEGKETYHLKKKMEGRFTIR